LYGVAVCCEQKEHDVENPEPNGGVKPSDSDGNVDNDCDGDGDSDGDGHNDGGDGGC
jgi:hypothetical protein